jgi:hypothetical protein
MQSRFASTGYCVCPGRRQQGRSGPTVASQSDQCVYVDARAGGLVLSTAGTQRAAAGRLGSPASRREGAAGPYAAGTRSRLWGVPPLYLAGLATPAPLPEKNRRATQSASRRKERPPGASLTALSGAGKQLSTLTKVALRPRPRGSMALRPKGSGSMD